MNDLEKKLQEKLTELRKPGTSLQKANDLYFEAKEIAINADEKDVTKKALILMAHGIQEVYKKGVFFFQKWQTGKTKPTDHELDLFSKMADELLEAIPKLAENELLAEYKAQYKDFNHFIAETTKNIYDAKVIVEAEKTLRQHKNQTSPSTDNNETNRTKSGTQQENTNQQNEQIQKLSKEIESLTKQLFELHKQTGEILELLKKNQDSNNPAKKQEIQQKLTQLQAQQQQVQNQLEAKKQTQQKILSNKDQEPKEIATNSQTQTQSNQDKFN